MAIDLATTLNYHGPEWAVMRAYLKELRELRVKQLIGPIDHDKSNLIRGELRLIETLLITEDAALRAAQGPR
jgi:hypothetical protein